MLLLGSSYLRKPLFILASWWFCLFLQQRRKSQFPHFFGDTRICSIRRDDGQLKYFSEEQERPRRGSRCLKTTRSIKTSKNSSRKRKKKNKKKGMLRRSVGAASARLLMPGGSIAPGLGAWRSGEYHLIWAHMQAWRARHGRGWGCRSWMLDVECPDSRLTYRNKSALQGQKRTEVNNGGVGVVGADMRCPQKLDLPSRDTMRGAMLMPARAITRTKIPGEAKLMMMKKRQRQKGQPWR